MWVFICLLVLALLCATYMLEQRDQENDGLRLIVKGLLLERPDGSARIDIVNVARRDDLEVYVDDVDDRTKEIYLR